MKPLFGMPLVTGLGMMLAATTAAGAMNELNARTCADALPGITSLVSALDGMEPQTDKMLKALNTASQFTSGDLYASFAESMNAQMNFNQAARRLKLTATHLVNELSRCANVTNPNWVSAPQRN
jgi:hypothetical protein